MAYTRIYENIYTFPVRTNLQSTNGIITAENMLIYFAPCPEIKNRHIVAISISEYNSYAGQTDQAFITLKDSKGNTLLYNYPAVDLQDTSGQNSNQDFRLRLFNFNDIDLAASYYFYNDLSGPLGNNNAVLFNLNFYLE